ncbi:methyltransferase domain-containing protein [Leptothoe sp. EHU-05/26/07-4]
MEFTGERYIPSEDGVIKYEHLHRYAIAKDFCKDRTVLDIASGEGYGSAMLSNIAESVFGVDIDPESIAHAQKEYAHKENLKFLLGSCDKIPLDDNSVEVVVSFETIEHHDKHEEMLAEISRVLTNDGILILSSPNKLTYSDEPNYQNPYHVKELYYEELRALIDKHFNYISTYGQKMGVSSFITSLESAADSSDLLASFTSQSKELIRKEISIPSPLYFLVICSNSHFEPLKSSLYRDEDDLYMRTRAQIMSLSDTCREISITARNLNAELKRTQTQSNESQLKLQDTQSKLQDTQSKLQDTQSKLQDTQSKLQDTQFELQDTQSKLQDTQKQLERNFFFIVKMTNKKLLKKIRRIFR